jgi:hypothetical protein
MIILESCGMSHSKKIAYSNTKIQIPQNERNKHGLIDLCIHEQNNTIDGATKTMVNESMI